MLDVMDTEKNFGSINKKLYVLVVVPVMVPVSDIQESQCFSFSPL